MKAKVTFISSRTRKYMYKYSLQSRFDRMLREFDLKKYVQKKEISLLKMHLGNPGANQTVRPSYVGQVVRAVQEAGGLPVVTDAMRIPPVQYLTVANHIGYNTSTLGCPVVIADGLFGRDSVLVPAGELLKEISIASAIYDATSMIVLTHVKGHILAGFAGSLKHVSMGGTAQNPRQGGWKHGRGKMHADWSAESRIEWDAARCTLCMACVTTCPLDMISVRDKAIVINHEDCVRCGRCARVCEAEALQAPVTFDYFVKAVSEGAKAVLGTFAEKKVLYLNFLLDMQPECDCLFAHDNAVVPNLGIMMSDDPVALDTATLDRIALEKPCPNSLAEGLEVPAGSDVFQALKGIDTRAILRECERLGLGTSEYELIEIG